MDGAREMGRHSVFEVRGFGSLVFALESCVTIPLGIHVGAPEAIPNHSVSICLEAFCYEAEQEGWELSSPIVNYYGGTNGEYSPRGCSTKYIASSFR